MPDLVACHQHPIFCLHSDDQEGRQSEKPVSDSGAFARPQGASDGPYKHYRDPVIAQNKTYAGILSP